MATSVAAETKRALEDKFEAAKLFTTIRSEARVLRNPDDVDDLIQRTFVVLLTTSRQLEHPEKLGAFARGIARKLLVKVIGRRSAEMRVLAALNIVKSLQNYQSSPEAIVGSRRAIEKVVRLAKVGPKYQLERLRDVALCGTKQPDDSTLNPPTWRQQWHRTRTHIRSNLT